MPVETIGPNKLEEIAKDIESMAPKSKENLNKPQEKTPQEMQKQALELFKKESPDQKIKKISPNIEEQARAAGDSKITTEDLNGHKAAELANQYLKKEQKELDPSQGILSTPEGTFAGGKKIEEKKPKTLSDKSKSQKGEFKPSSFEKIDKEGKKIHKGTGEKTISEEPIKTSKPIQPKEQKPPEEIKEDSNIEKITREAHHSPEAEAKRKEWKETSKDEKIEEKIQDTREQLLGNKEAERPEFLTERGEKEITEVKKSTTSRLENKLIKTGFFNKETAGNFISNFFAGEEDPWGKAKGEYAEKQWNNAKKILKERVESVISSIKEFDNLHENYLKYNSELFGKYINNLEKAFKSSEYYNNKEMINVQLSLEDARGLFDIHAKNLAQWRGRNKGLVGLIRRFRLEANKRFGSKKGAVIESILKEDEDIKGALEENNKKLIDKLKLLQTKINGEIDSIPENIVPTTPKEVKPVRGETLQKPEIQTEPEKRMGQIYSELAKKGGKYEQGDKGKIDELKNLIDTNPDAQIKYQDSIGNEVIVGATQASKNMEKISRVLEKSTQDKKESANKGLFTPRGTVPREKTEKIFTPKTKKETQEIKEEPKIKPAELPKEKRDELNQMLKNNAPEKDPVKNSNKLEKLMGIINHKDNPQEDKDVATLQFLNNPSVGIDSLDFGDKEKEEGFDKKKALGEKLTEISSKYANENDDLSTNINLLVDDIQSKFGIIETPRAETLAPSTPTTPEAAPVGAAK